MQALRYFDLDFLGSTWDPYPDRCQVEGKISIEFDFDIIRQHTAGSFQIWARLGLENPVGSGMPFPRARKLAGAFFWCRGE
jgi:hypothetical protein